MPIAGRVQQALPTALAKPSKNAKGRAIAPELPA